MPAGRRDREDMVYSHSVVMPVKPLSFKGDKKTKKRKRVETIDDNAETHSKAQVNPEENELWVLPENPTELTGPTVIVLPTIPPTCLASDPTGNVFASPLENMVEADPRTAEPHNVQQVWVASRVAGMKEIEVNLKGSHGGFLSCDQYGILGARREARGHEETFVIEAIMDQDTGRTSYALQTAATKSTKSSDRRYLCAGSDSRNTDDGGGGGEITKKKLSVTLRGDGEATSNDIKLVLRMQARFRPQTTEAKEAVRAKEKITRQELERAAGRSLTDDEAKRLKRAKRDGTYHEEILDIRAKGKHDKYA